MPFSNFMENSREILMGFVDGLLQPIWATSGLEAFVLVRDGDPVKIGKVEDGSVYSDMYLAKVGDDTYSIIEGVNIGEVEKINSCHSAIDEMKLALKDYFL
jgi:hypothetical protein